METKRPYIRVCACRHVAAPDTRGGVSIPSLSEGSGHCTGVRAPIEGPGPRGGPDLLERSGTPGCSGRAPAHPGTRGAPRPVPAGGRVRDCCWVNRAPDRRGPAVWTQSRVTTRLLSRHSKRGYPSPGVPTVAPGPTLGEVRTRRWGHYRDVFPCKLDCVGVLMQRAGVPDP